MIFLHCEVRVFAGVFVLVTARISLDMVFLLTCTGWLRPIRSASMAKRYELNDKQWARIADMLPGKTSDRLVVNGVLWVHDPEQTSPVRIGHRRRL